MDNNEHNQSLTENITHRYKKANGKTVNEIKEEFDDIALQLNISERIEQTEYKVAYNIKRPLGEFWK